MNIYDIAEKAGVSIATVSRVLNGSGPVSAKTRERVNKVMEEMGYSPNVFARGLMVNSMKLIGILTIDVRDLYYASAIHTLEVEARLRGYDVILCSTGNSLSEKKKYLKLLLKKRVDGIILVGSVFKENSDNSHISEAAASVPVVIINGQVDGNNIYSVACDDTRAVYDMVHYLWKKGHSNIACIYDVQTFSSMQKIKGYKKAMLENGVSTPDHLIVKTSEGLSGGAEAVNKLLEAGIHYTAIVATEDILAAGALKRLRELGKKVPEEIAVAGFNNSVISKCTTPELTTVDSKVEAISSLAIKALIDVIEGKNVPASTIVSPELVIRETT